MKSLVAVKLILSFTEVRSKGDGDMHSNSRQQSGFSIVEGVIAIVVVAVLGFIGWRLYTTYYGKQDSVATSISQTYTPNTVGLKVYSGVSNSTYDGTILPLYFISSDQQMSYYKLQLNQKVETHAFFTPFKSSIDNTSIESVGVYDIPAKGYP